MAIGPGGDMGWDFFVEAQFAIASAQHTELLQHYHMISPRELPFSFENIVSSEIYSPDLTSSVYFKFYINLRIH